MEVIRYLIIGFFVCLTIVDIVRREISCVMLILVTVLSVIYSIMEKRNLKEYIFIIIVGMVFFLLSIITREAIGLGDVWMGINILVFQGIWEGITVILWAAFFSSIAAIIFIVSTKIRTGIVEKKKRIPFLPFLLIGEIIVYI